jgi:hypothetical protein
MQVAMCLVPYGGWGQVGGDYGQDLSELEREHAGPVVGGRKELDEVAQGLSADALLALYGEQLPGLSTYAVRVVSAPGRKVCLLDGLPSCLRCGNRVSVRLHPPGDGYEDRCGVVDSPESITDLP